MSLYTPFLGKKVSIIIDRPKGSKHPTHHFVYPINYGYIPDTKAEDGKEVDVYVLDIEEPINTTEGRVIGIIVREDDLENKLLVTAKETHYTKESIRRLTHFQEQYFNIKILTLEDFDLKSFHMFRPERDADYFNQASKNHFPELLGIVVKEVKEGQIIAEMPIEKRLFAPNNFVHAGSIVTLADTIAGYSTIAHLPEKAKSFTTLELKSNFVRAIREGDLLAESTVEHLGRTTQVWRVLINNKQTGKRVAVFSCTQLILY